jgi:acetylglutamate kinase
MQLNIIKIGGNVIDSEKDLELFLKDLSQLQTPYILVHGGGKLATQMAAQLNIPQQMVDGRRITNADTLKIATMVYAGYINKTIVAGLQKYGVNAIGLSGADANIIKASKRSSTPIDFGFVGDVDYGHIQNKTLQLFLEQALTPVVCAITHDGNGQLLNTNADTIAAQIACSMSNHFKVKLIYCFEKNGVLLNADKDDSVIPVIDESMFQTYVNSGIIKDGMIPKMDNCFFALNNGVQEVRILHASQLKNHINHNSNDGTRIT